MAPHHFDKTCNHFLSLAKGVINKDNQVKKNHVSSNRYYGLKCIICLYIIYLWAKLFIIFYALSIRVDKLNHCETLVIINKRFLSII